MSCGLVVVQMDGDAQFKPAMASHGLRTHGGVQGTVG